MRLRLTSVDVLYGVRSAGEVPADGLLERLQARQALHRAICRYEEELLTTRRDGDRTMLRRALEACETRLCGSAGKPTLHPVGA